MKKIVALFLTLNLLLAAMPALAAGKLEVQQENLQLFKTEYSNYAYLYVKIANVGDRPIEISSSLLELYDAEGEVIKTDEYCSSCGYVLQPGEYTYAYFSEYLEEDVVVDDYISNFLGKNASGNYTTTRFNSQTSLAFDVQEGWGTYNYIIVTITNNTDETVYEPYAAGVLLDSEGNILYVANNSLYNAGIPAGSTVIFRLEIPSYVLENVEKDTLTADGLVYTNQYN